MRFNVITIFPKIISDYCDETILNRAQKKNIIKINPVNLRDFTDDNHKTVDDTPYGGGPGMVMKPEPIYKALASLNALSRKSSKNVVFEIIKKISNFTASPAGRQFPISKSKRRTILLSPRGKQFDQRMAEQLSKLDEITFVCGRYEGIDQRVVDYMVDEEVSIGPYVLAGGELGALIMIEAVSRLLPGVLGNEDSLLEETHTLAPQHLSTSVHSELESAQVFKCSSVQVNEYPQYTKPAVFRGWKVPDVLLSGDHKKIERWRDEQSQR